jgi:hypothetical protein
MNMGLTRHDILYDLPLLVGVALIKSAQDTGIESAPSSTHFDDIGVLHDLRMKQYGIA